MEQNSVNQRMERWVSTSEPLRNEPAQKQTYEFLVKGSTVVVVQNGDAVPALVVPTNNQPVGGKNP